MKPIRQAIKIQALKINIHHHVYPLLQKFLSLVINNCLLLYIKVLNKKILPDYIFLYQLLTFFVTFKKKNVHFFSAKLHKSSAFTIEGGGEVCGRNKCLIYRDSTNHGSRLEKRLVFLFVKNKIIL